MSEGVLNKAERLTGVMFLAQGTRKEKAKGASKAIAGYRRKDADCVMGRW